MTVEEQRDDPGSMLMLCRDLIALRRSEPDLSAGDYKPLPAPDGLWAFQRGERFVVVLNLSDARRRGRRQPVRPDPPVHPAGARR